jgi:hypothetical protein
MVAALHGAYYPLGRSTPQRSHAEQPKIQQKQKKLTRINSFTLLISPDCNCAANTAMSASETSHPTQSMTSQSAWNCFLPNFTSAAQHAGAAAGSALRLSKRAKICEKRAGCHDAVDERVHSDTPGYSCLVNWRILKDGHDAAAGGGEGTRRGSARRRRRGCCSSTLQR